MMSPSLRKLSLTIHVTTSVAWIGAVAAFLALAVVGVRTLEGARVREIYGAMDLVGWALIVPLAIASTASGIVQSLGTPWGLVRHYWLLIKLIMTVGSVGLLVLHMQPTGMIAAMEPGHAMTGLESVQDQLLFDAAAAIVVLLVATVLSIYKPKGMTGYGHRKAAENAAS